MKKLTSHIPNAITCCNLLSGCVAIVFALKGWSLFAFGMILVAAVFDFCDGFAARLLHAYSPIGKELDSLADVVSFGVAPSALLFYCYSAAPGGELIHYSPFILAAFSALRLAKFNLDSRQSENFIGLPTPACALFVGSLVCTAPLWPWLDALVQRPLLIPLLSLALSLLLVSEIPMFSMKIKHLNFKDNKIRILFLGGCVLIVVAAILLSWPFTAAILAIMSLYILLGFFLIAKA